MSTLPLVVITSETFDETRAAFTGVARVIANESVEPWHPTRIIDECRQASGIMAFMTDRIDPTFLAHCPELKVIGAALKGYDNIDVDAATANGVWVTIVPDLLTEPTAELAIGLTIALGRHIRTGDARIRAKGFAGWRPELYGIGLNGSTVGIVGFGQVGQAIARRLTGFGCRILAHDEHAKPHEISGTVMVPLTELLHNADVVILGLPLTPATTALISHDAIASMKTGALLINPARGSLVDERAVADALETGQLGGYAADVFECEDWARPDRPGSIEPRLAAPGAATVLTPHIGSAVSTIRREIEASAARSIIEALSGQTPTGAINSPNKH